MKELTFLIKGVAPLLMHSDQTANPLNSYSKKLKEITSKRKKTDEDHIAIAKIEWTASLYYADNNYYLPSAMIEANLLASAKQFKLGTLIKQACIVPEDAKFIFKHNDLRPDELYQIESYIDQRTVKVQMAKNIRTRPIFKEWEAEFTIWIDDEKMNPEEVIKIVNNAGKYVGLGDYRPRYGRYEVLKY